MLKSKIKLQNIDNRIISCKINCIYHIIFITKFIRKEVQVK